ncbi:MAG TPA: pentapeptide repeat-containing protein [Leptolyngbya sp.]|nr:pentapeptide repeat-containing protein [Leptolyngbya sp.]
MTGLVFGGGAVAVSLYVTGSQQFESLRMWALSIGCWRGTSFHNLDLSRINFRNANLANTDLRAQKLYRTCFQDVNGLNRAKVDNRYLDLGEPKVQQLLTRGCSSVLDFCRSNLQGAYLQRADMRGFDLTDANLTGADLKGADLRDSILIRTQLADADFQGVDLRKNILIDANLTGADLQGADLRGSILVRAQVARADFTGADLTGVCIEDWSVSSKTRFTDVRCDYVYRKYQDGQPSDRYPVDRNFEAGEFAFLFSEPEDVIELIFKGDFNYSALSLAIYKLQTEAPDLNLQLKGIEQRETLWVVKIKSSSGAINERLIEERLNSVYQMPNESNVGTVIKDSVYQNYQTVVSRLEASEQLVMHLAGVNKDQAEALKELSRKPFGNNFSISGSNIKNIAGSGQIDYHEAADQVRSLVTNSADPGQVIPILQSLFMQLSQQKVATTTGTQLEFIQQLIVAEAEKDQAFKHFLIQHQAQIMSAMPSDAIADAIQSAIQTVNSKLS